MSIPTINVEDLIHLLGTFYDQWGYLIVFLSTFAENTALLGLVLPGNTLALLGAFYARIGTLNLGWVIFFSTIGTVAGYHIDYLFGRFALEHFLTRWGTSRLGLRLRLAGRIRLSRRMLTRHGGKTILISHIIGHLRSFVALSAGLTHMRYARFLLFEIIAALLWNTLYSLIGYFVAVEIDLLQLFFERAGWIILGVLGILFVGWQIWKRRVQQKRRSKRFLQRVKQQKMLQGEQ
jgi:membrane protein DedA with SNARE-associated domain